MLFHQGDDTVLVANQAECGVAETVVHGISLDRTGTIMGMTTAATHRFRCPPARRGLAGAFGMA